MMAACRDPGVWRKRYEAVRGHAVCIGTDVLTSPPMGMYLICHYGIAEWMRRWEGMGADGMADGPPAHSPALRKAELPPASLWRGPLTVLLAQMTFQHLRSTPTL
jgi:hypothetical protein